MWPAIVTAFENVVADVRTVRETRSKVIGYLTKLKSYAFLCLTCCYLDVLELITPCSKIFEGEGLMAYEISPILAETTANIEQSITADIGEEMLTSHLASFRIENEELSSTFIKADDKHRSNANRERVLIPLDGFNNYLTDNSIDTAVAKKKEILADLNALIEAKFGDFSKPVFKNMSWFDPKNWTQDRNYGDDQLKQLSSHFEVPLKAAGFNESLVKKEWRFFRNFVKVHHQGVNAKELWGKVFCHKRTEYPNLCLLGEIIFSFSGSNSTVERAFSLLTLLLTDKRLSMKHATMQSMLIININDKIWTETEREDIFSLAVDKYLQKRRSKQMSEPPQKTMKAASSIEAILSDSETDEATTDEDTDTGSTDTSSDDDI